MSKFSVAVTKDGIWFGISELNNPFNKEYYDKFVVVDSEFEEGSDSIPDTVNVYTAGVALETNDYNRASFLYSGNAFESNKEYTAYAYARTTSGRYYKAGDAYTFRVKSATLEPYYDYENDVLRLKVKNLFCKMDVKYILGYGFTKEPLNGCAIPAENSATKFDTTKLTGNYANIDIPVKSASGLENGDTFSRYLWLMLNNGYLYRIDSFSYTHSTKKPDLWEWSNAVQNALDNKGVTTIMEYTEWNAFIDRIQETLEHYPEAGDCSEYISAARMNESDKVMTARRFNSARTCIGSMYNATDDWNKISGGFSRGDIVYGDYFNILANGLNDAIENI